MKKVLLALILLAVPACGAPAHAVTACLDPVINEVVFDRKLEPLYTFNEAQSERIQKSLGTFPDVDWTSIDVLYKPGEQEVLTLFNGRLPGRKDICIFDYGDAATITNIENLINALENEHDD